MSNFYSQNGEDYILSKIFHGQTDGFFVEVGCIDGKRFSNTLYFEELGWKGICIEAHPDYITLLESNRPNSIVENCAIGEIDNESVTFYANSRGTLSSLDRSREKYFEKNYGKYFTGYEKKLVKKRTLNSILSKHNIKKVDLLSIDIEGYEKYALQGLNFDKFDITVIVIEADLFKDKKDVNQILIKNKFEFLFSISSNLFYINKVYKFNNPVLQNKYQKIPLTHTAHPLDDVTDREVKIDITLLKELYKKRQNKFIALLKSMFLKKKKVKTQSTKYTFLNEGFHGDKYLQSFIDKIITENNISYFIETGTNVGSTLAYVAKKYPALECISCEPEEKSYIHAIKNTKKLKNVKIYNLDSVEFIQKLEKDIPNNAKVVVWLDAHGYGFKWPLKEEVSFFTNHFTNPFIFIDDFKVPNQTQFDFDNYNKQECSFEFIQDSLSKEHEYTLVYPHYIEKTSKFHPLRGWVLLTYNSNFVLSQEESLNYFQIKYLKDKFKYDFKGKFNSVGVNGDKYISKFIDNKEFPYLVSFPRTGSHWLRNIMELYFEKPSLTRIFHFFNKEEFTCLHTHDDNLDIKRKNVIYLYRNAVDTIYSLIIYYKQDPFDINNIIHWSKSYANHLKKWLLDENFTQNKVIIKYEVLQKDFISEFGKICNYLDSEVNDKRLNEIFISSSKEKIRDKTKQNPQVVNSSKDYDEIRKKFRKNFEKTIHKTIEEIDTKLIDFIKND